MDNHNNNVKNFSYYSRILMFIILSIEFILNIIFLIIISGIKSNSDILEFIKKKVFKVHTDSINTIFSFFFICYFAFCLELMAYCDCFIRCNCNKPYQYVFIKLNHFIILLAFFICQFLYLIQCLIIPVYCQIVNDLLNEEINKGNEKINYIKNRYSAMTGVCYAFLAFIIFLDLIVINLYKGICLQMEEICQKTQNCFENFGKWFISKLSFICCAKEKGIIRQLDEIIKEKDEEIKNKTAEIKNLMAKNISLNLEVLN